MPENFSIGQLTKLFPEFGNEVFFQDLYKALQPITRNGARLNGTEPYDHDPTYIQQYKATWKSIEVSDAKNVVLLGSYVRDAFLRRYNVDSISKTGTRVTVGGKVRTFWHIRHPEHTGKYATAKQLEELRVIVTHMQKFLTIGFPYLNNLIRKRTKYGPKEMEPPGGRERHPTQAEAIATRSKLQQQEAQRLSFSEKLRQLWKDPNSGHATNSQKMSQLWQDPNGPFAHVAAKLRLQWTPERRTAFGQTVSKRWKDGVYAGYSEAIQKYRTEWPAVSNSASTGHCLNIVPPPVS